MNIHFTKTKFLILTLAIFLLLQSCHVYKKVPLSLDEAVAANRIVKVTTVDNRKFIYHKIEKADSTYYGVKTVKRQDVRVLIRQKDVQSIRAVDKGASTLLTAVAVVVPIAIAALLVIADGSTNYAGSDPD